MTLILGLGLGGMCAFYVRGLLRRGPAIVIDAEGLRDLRSGRAVRWASVSEILLRQRQGLFGEHHHLVLTVAGSTAAASELDISIDLLSMSWKTVVDAVEERAGRRVIVRRERGVVTR